MTCSLRSTGKPRLLRCKSPEVAHNADSPDLPKRRLSGVERTSVAVELGDPGANERAIGLLSEELVDQRVEAVRHDPVFVMRGRLSRHLLIRTFRGTAKFRRAAALPRPRSRQTTMVCCAERPRYEPVLLTPVPLRARGMTCTRWIPVGTAVRQTRTPGLSPAA